MTPFTPETAGPAGALGGARQTTAQIAARVRMQRSRRGVRVHPADPGAIKALRGLISHGHTRRGLATELGVADSTVRRWLAGTDWPAPHHARAIRRLAHPIP